MFDADANPVIEAIKINFGLVTQFSVKKKIMEEPFETTHIFIHDRQMAFFRFISRLR